MPSFRRINLRPLYIVYHIFVRLSNFFVKKVIFFWIVAKKSYKSYNFVHGVLGQGCPSYPNSPYRDKDVPPTQTRRRDLPVSMHLR